MSRLTDEQFAEIRQWDLMRGLSLDEVGRIVGRAGTRTIRSGETVCRQNEPGDTMFMIHEGRVRMSVVRQDGSETPLSVLDPGAHFGELALLGGGARTATATAITDTTVFEIGRNDFLGLLTEIPAFSINLTTTIGGWLRSELTGRKTRDLLGVLAVVRTTEALRPLVGQLAASFADRGRRVGVVSNRAATLRTQLVGGRSRATDGIEIREAPLAGDGSIDPYPVRDLLTAAAARHEHVLLDLPAEAVGTSVLMQCENIWWLVDQNASVPENGLDRLREMIEREPVLAGRVRVIFSQRDDGRLLAASEHGVGLELPALRIRRGADTDLVRPMDLARLSHLMTGVQLGLALGGGGAKGLAHVGVLAALDEAGIHFDRVAGTSAGAIIAAAHAVGMSFESMLSFIHEEMTAPRWITWLPKGAAWHLMGLFRLNLVEQRFRRHLLDYTFEQALLPVHMVAVDLISGNEVVRSAGDLVDALMESINHPLFGSPIFRDGQALVDGSVLNNVPISVLRQESTDYVVAVDVGTQIAPRYGGNTADLRSSEMATASYLTTLSRMWDIRNRGLSALHMAECDFLIGPDTSSFPFEDFTSGRQLFDIGYEATQHVLPQLSNAIREFTDPRGQGRRTSRE